jgi:hypothetical protein
MQNNTSDGNIILWLFQSHFFSKSKHSIEMALKEVTVIFLYLVLFSITIKSIIVYNNARFDPIDTRFILGQPFLVPSADDCVCECFNNTICFAATYFGINHICSLYFAQIYQGQLRVVPSIMNATAYFFNSATTTGK